jgi:Cu/Ag efflux pump CusA
MAGSLVLSLTVIPALSSLLLRSRGEHEALMFRVLRPAYARALDVALRGRVVVLAVAGALLVASVAAFPLLGTEFVPTLEEGSMMYRITNIPSASLKNVLASVKGAKDVQVETLLGKPTVTLQVDRAAAARFGLNVADVLEVVRAGIGGEVVSTIIDGPRRYEVVVRFDEASRRDVADILRIPVRTSEGNIVPLSRVAEAVVTSGVAKVRRESLSRLIVVQANVEGRDVGGFVAEAQERIAKAVKFPPGYGLGRRLREPAASHANPEHHRATDHCADPGPALHGVSIDAPRAAHHLWRALLGRRRDPRAAPLRPEPLGARRDWLYRRLRRGHAERRRPRRVPRPAP